MVTHNSQLVVPRLADQLRAMSSTGLFTPRDLFPVSADNSGRYDYHRGISLPVPAVDPSPVSSAPVATFVRVLNHRLVSVSSGPLRFPAGLAPRVCIFDPRIQMSIDTDFVHFPQNRALIVRQTHAEEGSLERQQGQRALRQAAPADAPLVEMALQSAQEMPAVERQNYQSQVIEATTDGGRRPSPEVRQALFQFASQPSTGPALRRQAITGAIGQPSLSRVSHDTAASSPARHSASGLRLLPPLVDLSRVAHPSPTVVVSPSLRLVETPPASSAVDSDFHALVIDGSAATNPAESIMPTTSPDLRSPVTTVSPASSHRGFFPSSPPVVRDVALPRVPLDQPVAVIWAPVLVPVFQQAYAQLLHQPVTSPTVSYIAAEAVQHLLVSLESEAMTSSLSDTRITLHIGLPDVSRSEGRTVPREGFLIRYQVAASSDALPIAGRENNLLYSVPQPSLHAEWTTITAAPIVISEMHQVWVPVPNAVLYTRAQLTPSAAAHMDRMTTAEASVPRVEARRDGSGGNSREGSGRGGSGGQRQGQPEQGEQQEQRRHPQQPSQDAYVS